MLVVALAAGFAAIAPAEILAPVTRFSDYPFDQWANAPDHSGIKWEIRLPAAELSVHQRLIQRIQAIVPGRELERRRGRGELVVLTRIERSDGMQWTTGSRLNLVSVQGGVKSEELTFTLAAFVKPGDYRVLVALLDTETMDHSFTRRALRVAPLKADPLPQAWLSLPDVEFLSTADAPDSWFLPDVKGLLHLPFEESRQPRVDLLVNVTPSERAFGPSASLRRNLAAIIPALKVLIGLNERFHSPSASVIDLARHRISFETTNSAHLAWPALSKVLSESNPNVIDAKSLAGIHSMREYFADEVARRAGASGPSRWLIVMSGATFFSRQEETPLPELPPDPNRHIVYLKFLPGFGGGTPGRGPGPGFGGRGGPGGSGGGGLGGASGAESDPGFQIAPPERIHGPTPGLGTVLPPGRGRGGSGGAQLADDLEHVLRPMGAQVFGIATPEQFRKVVASLVAEMAGQATSGE